MRRTKILLGVTFSIVSLWFSPLAGRGKVMYHHCSERPLCIEGCSVTDQCYLSQNPSEIDQHEADLTCDGLNQENSCGGSASATEDSGCWLCQVERPGR